MKICELCNCEIKSRRLNICDKCYGKQYWQKIKPSPKIKIRHEFCIDCGKKRKPHGRSVKYCEWCAFKNWQKKHPDSVEKRKIQNRNYNRVKRGIDINLPPLRRKFGEGHKNKDGYIILSVKGHPNCTNKSGSISQHTLFMSEHIGRPIRKDESVHHKNGIRDDNRIENLELWHKGHPAGQRLEDKIKWAKEFLESYGYAINEPKS